MKNGMSAKSQLLRGMSAAWPEVLFRIEVAIRRQIGRAERVPPIPVRSRRISFRLRVHEFSTALVGPGRILRNREQRPETRDFAGDRAVLLALPARPHLLVPSRP